MDIKVRSPRSLEEFQRYVADSPVLGSVFGHKLDSDLDWCLGSNPLPKHFPFSYLAAILGEWIMDRNGWGKSQQVNRWSRVFPFGRLRFALGKKGWHTHLKRITLMRWFNSSTGTLVCNNCAYRWYPTISTSSQGASGRRLTIQSVWEHRWCLEKKSRAAKSGESPFRAKTGRRCTH